MHILQDDMDMKYRLSEHTCITGGLRSSWGRLIIVIGLVEVLAELAGFEGEIEMSVNEVFGKRRLKSLRPIAQHA